MLSLTKLGGWAFGELLTSVQMEALDASQAKAIDGTGGGTYTPSVKIIINGQGLQVNTLTVTGTLSLLGNTTVGNAPADVLSVLATSTFSAPVTLNDALTANDTADFFADTTIHTAALFTVGGSALLGNDSGKNLTVGATSTFNASATFNESVDVWGDLTCHSATLFTAGGDVQLGNDTSKTLSIGAALITRLVFGSGGIIPFRLYDGLGNGDATISVADGNVFHLPHANSAVRAYTLSSSGAQKSDFAIFYQGFGTNQANDVVIKANGGEVYRFVAGAAASFLVMFYRSSWEVAFATND
jgi:hypothetical protein